jgi:hypothetical protein
VGVPNPAGKSPLLNIGRDPVGFLNTFKDIRNDSDDFSEVVAIGSIEQLRELSGYEGELTDIHRDKVDHITIPQRGSVHLRRAYFQIQTNSQRPPEHVSKRHFLSRVSDDFSEVVAIGSIEQLRELSGYEGELTDIHRGVVYTCEGHTSRFKPTVKDLRNTSQNAISFRRRDRGNTVAIMG